MLGSVASSRPQQVGLVLLVLVLPSLVMLGGYRNGPSTGWNTTVGLPVRVTVVNGTQGGVDVSLGRPLCLVLVMGSGINLTQTAGPLQRTYPNCFFHIYSPVLLVPPNTWPPPPPYAFYHHGYYLVGDDYDAVGPLVDARPLLLNTVGDVVDPEKEGRLRRPQEPLRASTVFSHYELNRIAAVVAHLETSEDEQALKDGLRAITQRRRHEPQWNNTRNVIDLVVVHRSATTTCGPADWLRDKAYGSYAQWDRDGGQGDAVYYIQPDVGLPNQDLYPPMPTMIGFGTFAYGRATNQFIQDSRYIAYFGELCANRTKGTWLPICDRVILANEADNLHDGAHLTMYNISRMYEAGFLPNRFLSPVEVVTIETLAFCKTNGRTLRYKK